MTHGAPRRRIDADSYREPYRRICIAPSSQANKHDIRILERMHVASTLLLRQEQTPGGAIEGLIVD